MAPLTQDNQTSLDSAIESAIAVGKLIGFDEDLVRKIALVAYCSGKYDGVREAILAKQKGGAR